MEASRIVSFRVIGGIQMSTRSVSSTVP
jgi:putative transposase